MAHHQNGFHFVSSIAYQKRLRATFDPFISSRLCTSFWHILQSYTVLQSYIFNIQPTNVLGMAHDGDIPRGSEPTLATHVPHRRQAVDLITLPPGWELVQLRHSECVSIPFQILHVLHDYVNCRVLPVLWVGILQNDDAMMLTPCTELCNRPRPCRLPRCGLLQWVQAPRINFQRTVDNVEERYQSGPVPNRKLLSKNVWNSFCWIFPSVFV